jgi:hypothetical protein
MIAPLMAPFSKGYTKRMQKGIMLQVQHDHMMLWLLGS